MYMHYSPKKLLMTLTCIDIYACNIVSPNPQVHSKTIVSTYQTYYLLHKYFLKILKTKDKRQKTKSLRNTEILGHKNVTKKN